MVLPSPDSPGVVTRFKNEQNDHFYALLTNNHYREMGTTLGNDFVPLLVLGFGELTAVDEFT